VQEPIVAGERNVTKQAGLSSSFRVGDAVVHPSHGVGRLIAMEDREVGAQKLTFFVITMLDSGLKVMVSRDSADRVGLRPVMTEQESDVILEILRSPDVAVSGMPWTRRIRAYTDMLKSGVATEIAKVLRDMWRLRLDKDLSFGERRLLDQARGLLLCELGLARHVERADIERQILALFTS